MKPKDFEKLLKQYPFTMEEIMRTAAMLGETEGDPYSAKKEVLTAILDTANAPGRSLFGPIVDGEDTGIAPNMAGIYRLVQATKKK